MMVMQVVKSGSSRDVHTGNRGMNRKNPIHLVPRHHHQTMRLLLHQLDVVREMLGVFHHQEEMIDIADIRLRHIIEIIVIVFVMNVIGTRGIDLGMIETGLEMIVTDMLILEDRGVQ